MVTLFLAGIASIRCAVGGGTAAGEHAARHQRTRYRHPVRYWVRRSGRILSQACGEAFTVPSARGYRPAGTCPWRQPHSPSRDIRSELLMRIKYAPRSTLPVAFGIRAHGALAISARQARRAQPAEVLR